MISPFVSICIIALVAFICPFIASLIPGRPIPETVFLVFAGALLGPFGFHLISVSGDSIHILSELGLAFLFLMAGYEIEPKNIVGSMGKHAFATWIFSFVLALVIAAILPFNLTHTTVDNAALAIAMTTTAFGTLAPILSDRGLVGTQLGNTITAYGALGEILPVLAMAFLLSSRSPFATAIILIVFGAICFAIVQLPNKARQFGSKLVEFLHANAETGSQATTRLTVLLLIALVAFSAIFDLDIVLGAFAAGFILRGIVPHGDKTLEMKLDGIAYGFLVPLFFVVSGANINLRAAFHNPGLLIGFMVLLFVVRTIPIILSLRINPQTNKMPWYEKFAAALYCTMALPIIVAVTTVATSDGAMTQEMASVLVTAGAATVLIIPILTSFIRIADAAHPLSALHDIVIDHSSVSSVLQEHARHFHHAMHTFKVAQHEYNNLSSLEYLAGGDNGIPDFYTLTPEEKARKRMRRAKSAHVVTSCDCKSQETKSTPKTQTYNTRYMPKLPSNTKGYMPSAQEQEKVKEQIKAQNRRSRALRRSRQARKH